VELVNHTPIPADLRTAHILNTSNRRGFLTAKATFSFHAGRLELERDRPLPVLAHRAPHGPDELPVDVTTEARDHFEVMLIGAAAAPAGERVGHRRVRVAVGSVAREMDVFGDRTWVNDAISAPVPFERMPLRWDRAFGGSTEVEVDEGAYMPFVDPMNPLGRGFDPAEETKALAEELNTPPGFPRYPRQTLLPNLEDPAHRIVRRGDRPRPVCWAPVPEECGIRIAHILDRDRSAPPPLGKHDPELVAAARRDAHPAWWIERPAAGARLRLAGLFSDEDVDLELPALRIFGDYILGNRRGARELAPQALLILSDERRLSITYRTSFLVHYAPGEERGFRLRTEEGWHGGHHG
jgi:hypothetical protein